MEKNKNEDNNEAAFLESLFKNEPQKVSAPKSIEKSIIVKKDYYYTLSEHEGSLKRRQIKIICRRTLFSK